MDLDAAVQAYARARAHIDEARRAARQLVVAAQDRAEQARLELAAAIVAEAEAGTPQVEIIRRTGYSREGVRAILRRGGVEAD